MGSLYNDKKLGSFGTMSSFSFYYGHHMSTIEGGMVCTNDDKLYNILLSIRSHGWDRDLPENEKQELREKYGVNDFRALYTFYYPGFNLRSTDLQAFIGIEQLKTLDFIVNKRNENFNHYNSLLKDGIWKIKPPKNSYVSNFAYPLITDKINEIVSELNNHNIECRPLICGAMSKQPFWYNKYGHQTLKNADKVHEYGLYLPNHQGLNYDDIKHICNIVNNIL